MSFCPRYLGALIVLQILKPSLHLESIQLHCVMYHPRDCAHPCSSVGSSYCSTRTASSTIRSFATLLVDYLTHKASQIPTSVPSSAPSVTYARHAAQFLSPKSPPQQVLLRRVRRALVSHRLIAQVCLHSSLSRHRTKQYTGHIFPRLPVAFIFTLFLLEAHMEREWRSLIVPYVLCLFVFWIF